MGLFDGLAMLFSASPSSFLSSLRVPLLPLLVASRLRSLVLSTPGLVQTPFGRRPFAGLFAAPAAGVFTFRKLLVPTAVEIFRCVGDAEVTINRLLSTLPELNTPILSKPLLLGRSYRGLIARISQSEAALLSVT